MNASLDLLRDRFPEALAAYLGPGVLSPARTPTSDLDIVVIRAGGHPVFRETVRHAGWPVELFVQTPGSFEWFVAREVAGRHSPLLAMVGLGELLVDADGTGARLQADARRRWAAGPPPASVDDLADLRYQLSDALDDLDGATDPDEVLFIATTVFTEAATLALTAAGSWLGAGKWLSRRLRDIDPPLHGALTAAMRAAAGGDPRPLRQAAYGVLGRAGGRLMEGYHRPAPAAAHRS